MYTLLALAVTALAAASAAHPGIRAHGVTSFQDDALMIGPQTLNGPANDKPTRNFFMSKYLKPRSVYNANENVKKSYLHPPVPTDDWVKQEIDFIDQLQNQPSRRDMDNALPRWLSFRPFARYQTRKSMFIPEVLYPNEVPRKNEDYYLPSYFTDEARPREVQTEKTIFALTPLDDGYFEPTENVNLMRETGDALEGPHEGGGHEDEDELEPRRPIRQNPNHSRTKTLVSEDLDKLRDGVDSDKVDFTEKPKYIHVFGSEINTETIYNIGVAMGVGVAIIVVAMGLAFAWYTLSKRAKAAAAVDYPAYGVTGPTMDTSGDRKLAHSAQMYHYQHQKQQIIAMERKNEDCVDSVSDPESEDENEEGDYTVYECPGFATTGDMEVKNPLFNEEPTPATPGKTEEAKPQPKE